MAPAAFWLILGAVALLSVIGLVMVASASTVLSVRIHGTAWHFFERQAYVVVVGSVAMLVVSRIDHRRFERWATLLLGSAFVGLVLVLVDSPISRGRVKGSARWLDIGPVDFQPSELAKLAVIVWVAGLLSRRAKNMGDWRMTYLPVGLMLAPILLLVFLEPDLGTIVVVLTVVGVMMVVAGARLDLMFLAALGILPLLAYQAFSGYHADRWGFLNPWEDPEHTGFQLLGSMSGVASGGWFGVGPGASKAKWGYLPEAHTDAIFAVVGEEFGLVGSVAVIALYATLVLAGVRVARTAPDRFGALLATGLSAWIGFQAFVNIGVSVGVLPNKGFTLPFVSYGGSSLLVLLVAAGMLLGIARRAR